MVMYWRDWRRSRKAGASSRGSLGFFVAGFKEARRVRFGIIDVVLAVVAMILLVLVIRQLIY